MTALTPIAALTIVVTRAVRCADCPAEIQQTGVQVGDRWLWSPVRCPSCVEQRDVTIRTEDARRGAEDSQGRQLQQQRQVAKALEDLQVPPKYRDATLETFERHGSEADRAIQQHVVRMGLRYLGTWPEPAQDTLVLRGGYGTGKGHWAWSVVKGIVAATGARTRVVKLADLVRRLRESWGQADAESETSALKFYRELDLLVIDEVSTHAFYGQNIHQHLYDVLDHRIEWSRPTILTSNEGDTGLEGILRPALMDRLQYRGGILEFGTASFRALERTPSPREGA